MQARQTALFLVAAAMAACGDDEAGQLDANVPVVDAAVDDGPSGDADTRIKLSQQGLYQDITTLTIAADGVEYVPAYALWSDGLVKRRWIFMPGGAPIDTSDMDHWVFPTGTKIFKEFALASGQRLETRLIEKVGAGDTQDDWEMSAFIWEADGSDAVQALGGMLNVLGTTHDVPASNQCFLCHDGEPGKVLGFSAMQLSTTNDPNLTSIGDDGWLSAPPPAGTTYPVPGTPVEAAALGYLHANCGHCHNPTGDPPSASYTDTCINTMGTLTSCQLLRLSVGDAALAPSATAMYASIVGQDTIKFQPGLLKRVAPGDHAASAIWIRMNQRGSGDQMPPRFFTNTIDDAGVAAVQAWIDSL